MKARLSFLLAASLAVFFRSPASAVTTNQMIRSVAVIRYLETLATNGTLDVIYGGHFSPTTTIYVAGRRLNSNGPNIAGAVNVMLNDHFATGATGSATNAWAEGTWRVYYLGTSGAERGFNIFATPEVVAESSVGTPVAWVLKYNTVSRKFSTGTSRVLRDTATTAMVIDGDIKNLAAFDPSTLPADTVDPDVTPPVPSLWFGKPFGIVCFGTLNLVNASVSQSVLAWGNAAVTGSVICADHAADPLGSRDALLVGGDFQDDIGSINGNIAFAGSRFGATPHYILPYYQFHQFPLYLNEYGNAADSGLGRASALARVRALASALAALPANGSTSTVASVFTLTGSSAYPTNVFDVSVGDWRGSVRLDVPRDSHVVVNIHGAAATASPSRIVFGSSHSPTNVIFHYVDAVSAVIGGGTAAGSLDVPGTVLVPYGRVTWRGGFARGMIVVYGNLSFTAATNTATAAGSALAGTAVAVTNEPPVGLDAAGVVTGSADDIMVPRSDLAVSSLVLSGAEFQDGDPVTIVVTVTNHGVSAAAPTTLGVYRSASLVLPVATEPDQSFDIPALAVGASATVTCSLPIIAGQGEHFVRAFADCMNTELEPDEADNQLTATYFTDPIHLAISVTNDVADIHWNNYPGQTYTLYGATNLENAVWVPFRTPVPSAREFSSATNIEAIGVSTGFRFFRIGVIKR